MKTLARQQAEFICDTLRIAQPVKCVTVEIGTRRGSRRTSRAAARRTDCRRAI